MKRVEAETRNSAYRATKDKRTRLDTVERELGVAQSRHDELVEMMARPEFYSDKARFESALAEYAVLKKSLPLLEDEWMVLSDEIAQLEAEAAS